LLKFVKVLENALHTLSDSGYHWREQDKEGWRVVREINMAELHYSAISQTVLWCHFIFATACSQRLESIFFLVRHLWRLEKLSLFLYILPSIIQDNLTFHGKKFTTSCTRIRVLRTLHNRH